VSRQKIPNTAQLLYYLLKLLLKPILTYFTYLQKDWPNSDLCHESAHPKLAKLQNYNTSVVLVTTLELTLFFLITSFFNIVIIIIFILYKNCKMLLKMPFI